MQPGVHAMATDEKSCSHDIETAFGSPPKRLEDAQHGRRT